LCRCRKISVSWLGLAAAQELWESQKEAILSGCSFFDFVSWYLLLLFDDRASYF